MTSRLFGCTGGGSRDSRSNSTGSTCSDSAVGVATKPGAAVWQSCMPRCLPGRSRQSSWSAEWCLVRSCCCQSFTGTLAICLPSSIHSVTHPPTHSLTHPSLTPSMNSFVVWETVKSATKQQQAKQMSTQRFWNKQHIQPCDCSHMSTAQHHCSICLQVRSCMHDSKIGKATDWNRMHAPQQAKQGNRLA